MAQFFSTIGRHLECAIQTELVVELELALLERKQYFPNSFGANVHLRKQKLKTGKVIERSRDVTPRSKVEKSKGRPRFPCAPNMVQFRPLSPELRHFEKKMARHLFRSAAILKVLVRPNWFSNLSEP